MVRGSIQEILICSLWSGTRTYYVSRKHINSGSGPLTRLLIGIQMDDREEFEVSGPHTE